jgi:hypothetical protein
VLSGKFLKGFSHKILQKLTPMYNAVLQTLSMESGKFIMIVKEGKIPNYIISYRPISLSDGS